MRVRGHDDERIDTQPFALVVVIETFSDDKTGFFGNENGQLFDDGKSQIVNSYPFLNLIRFHSNCRLISCEELKMKRGNAPTTRDYAQAARRDAVPQPLSRTSERPCRSRSGAVGNRPQPRRRTYPSGDSVFFNHHLFPSFLPCT